MGATSIIKIMIVIFRGKHSNAKDTPNSLFRMDMQERIIIDYGMDLIDGYYISSEFLR